MKQKDNAVLVLSSLFAVLLVAFSAEASESAKNALVISATSVIPAVFPMSVLSSLIVSRIKVGGKGENGITEALFGLCPQSLCAVMIGTLSGFPVGAKSACELYEAGVVDKAEAERAIALSSNTGAAFAVSVCGRTFFGSAKLGAIMYAVECASVLAVMLTAARFAKRRRNIGNTPISKPISLTDAVVSSVTASVNVTVVIVFFSVLSSFVGMTLGFIGAPLILRTFVCGLIEFSGGVKSASAFGDFGVCLAMVFISFSGVSVIMQLSSIAEKSGLSIKKCVVYKAIEGVLSAAVMLILSKCDAVTAIETEAVATAYFADFTAVIPSIFAVFSVVITAYSSNRHKKRNSP